MTERYPCGTTTTPAFLVAERVNFFPIRSFINIGNPVVFPNCQPFPIAWERDIDTITQALISIYLDRSNYFFAFEVPYLRFVGITGRNKIFHIRAEGRGSKKFFFRRRWKDFFPHHYIPDFCRAVATTGDDEFPISTKVDTVHRPLMPKKRSHFSPST